jgi:hypothetical protein
MYAHIAVMWCFSVCVFAAADIDEQSTGALCVTLVSSKDEYVLGEPVLLMVAAKNASREGVEAYPVFVDRTEPEISIHISQNGITFERYAMGVFGNVNYAKILEVLPPEQAWVHRLRILYTYKHPNRLAFPEPGRYRLKAVFPLMGREPTHPSRKKEFESSGREEFQSNTIQISIKEPEGVDAALWKTLRDPDFLHFMQGGFTERENLDVPLRAARLVNSVPDSSYHDALRWALKEYYIGQLPTKLEPARQEIEKALTPKDQLLFRKLRGEATGRQ